jgi:hypothetical protein
MRPIAIVLSAAILAACGKKDAPPAADTTQARNPGQTPASPMSAEAVAGNWQVQVMGMDTDSVLVTYDMSLSADTAAWTITLPNREPMKLRIMSMGGDSAVVENGPYESVLRPGVQVSTSTILRLRGDRLMGRTAAHYAIGGTDSVVQLRSRGRRAP